MNRLHFDVVATHTDLNEEVAQLVSLGASRLDTGRAGSAGSCWPTRTVNEFCVLSSQ
jgi:hypothetical protein